MGASDDQQARRESLAEYARFGTFVVILLGVVLAIALLRPLVFGRVIPAVLGLDTVQDISPAGVEEARDGEPEVEDAGQTVDPGPRLHTVQEGQTLQEIAVLYGVSVEAIAGANNILNPHNIEHGTLLKIPPPE